jgi:hypothetical protein
MRFQARRLAARLAWISSSSAADVAHFLGGLLLRLRPGFAAERMQRRGSGEAPE